MDDGVDAAVADGLRAAMPYQSFHQGSGRFSPRT